MKREFLQSIQIGEQRLPKEVIDAIMEENGRDIQSARAAGAKPYADYDAILAENESLKNQQALCEGKSAAQWRELYCQAAAEYEKQLDTAAFQSILEQTVSRMGGRNTKAITALLDIPSLQGAENRQKALEDALYALQKAEGYLFQSPPPYAGGTGTTTKQAAPESLAGALREKMERKY